ncbi:MAG: glycosyltransferase family 9 protein [Thermodesulfobacteriota bacterium]
MGILITKKPEKILIIRLSAIGDVVHVLPALRLLRSHFPESKIAWLVEDKASDILTGHPDIDDVIVFPRKRWQREISKINKTLNTLSDILSFYKKLRKERFDLVIDFQGNLKSGIMNLVTGSEKRVGFGRGYCKEFNYLTTQYQMFPSGKKMHRIDKNLFLLRELGIETSFQRPRLPVFKPDKKYISKFINTDINQSLPIIIIHPGTSKFGSYKQWPPLNYALLADMILDAYEANVIFTWGPYEFGVVKEIVEKMRHKALPACETRSIKQLIELIRHASLFIGGDTGPLHIASILDTPVVGIYGPKDPAIYGPYNGKAIVIKKDVPCSPCRKRTCGDPICMSSILPESVFLGVEKLFIKERH